MRNLPRIRQFVDPRAIVLVLFVQFLLYIVIFKDAGKSDVEVPGQRLGTVADTVVEAENLVPEDTVKMVEFEASRVKLLSKDIVDYGPFKPHRIALVVPFIEDQVQDLLNHLRLWDFSYFPCDVEKNYGPHIDLVLYFNRDLGQKAEIQKLISEELESMSFSRKCWNDYFFISAGLDDSEDVYPDGTCHQFYRIFEFDELVEKYTYFFLFEPDTRPIRPHWLDAIYEEAVLDFHDFWVKGSIYVGAMYEPCCGMGYEEWPYAYHINGNALYRLGDEKFNEFLEKVKSDPAIWQEGQSSKKHMSCPFDAGMAVYLWAKHRFHENRHILHKFVFTDFVQNYASGGYSCKELNQDQPGVFLVHGKGERRDCLELPGSQTLRGN